jgi:hypothetical protein
MTEKSIEARARRAARHAGLMAKKWRGRLGTVDNYGGFMLIEPRSNRVVGGERFQLSPDDVIEICRERKCYLMAPCRPTNNTYLSVA